MEIVEVSSTENEESPSIELDAVDPPVSDSTPETTPSEVLDDSSELEGVSSPTDDTTQGTASSEAPDESTGQSEADTTPDSISAETPDDATAESDSSRTDGPPQETPPQEDDFQAEEYVAVTSVAIEGLSSSKQWVGDTYQLHAVLLPENASNKGIVWESADNDIAMVDQNGLVTIVAAGATSIYATSIDKAECSPSVSINSFYPPTGISFGAENYYYKPGDVGLTNLNIEFAGDPSSYDSITYTSSDDTIAIMNENGTIAVHSAGAATITATIQPGGYTASCVVRGYVEITDLALNKDELILDSVDKNYVTAD